MSYKLNYKFSDRESQIAELSARLQRLRSAIVFSGLDVSVSDSPLKSKRVHLEEMLKFFREEVTKYNVPFLNKQYVEIWGLFEKNKDAYQD